MENNTGTCLEKQPLCEGNAYKNERILAGSQLPVCRTALLLDNPLLKKPLSLDQIKKKS